MQQAREAKIADLKVLAEQIQRVPSLTIEALAYEANAEQTEPAEGEEPITHFHLYGSVGAAEISKALKGKNLKVEPDMVKLDGVIKKCGLYEVNLTWATTSRPRSRSWSCRRSSDESDETA